MTDNRPLGYLLDIDGTLLVRSSGHLDVLAAVLTRRLGVPVNFATAGESPQFGGRDMSGMVDAQLVREVLVGSGACDVDENLVREIVLEYGGSYSASVKSDPAVAGLVVPGAREFLHRAYRNGGVLALSTGNVASVAKAKLSAFGLDEYFEFGPDLGFGDWRKNREAVARAAMTAVEKRHVRRSECVLVGDTTRDMDAAKALGIRGVGVATGANSLEALARAGAWRTVSSVGSLWGANESG